MPICILTISSKNKQSLFNYLFFLFNNSKINFIIKYKNKQIKKKIITVLKSPHVNKTAQEQFEIRIFSKQLLLFCYNLPKFLIILKKIKIQLFPDIKIKIKFLINNKNSLKTKLNLFFPYKYKLSNYNEINYALQSINCYNLKLFQNKKYQNFKFKNLKRIKNYCKIFDCYGELNLINI